MLDRDFVLRDCKHILEYGYIRECFISGYFKGVLNTSDFFKKITKPDLNVYKSDYFSFYKCRLFKLCGQCIYMQESFPMDCVSS